MSQRPWGCLFEVAETLVLTLIIFLVIQTFVAQPYKVEQQSMEDTLLPGEYVLVDKLTPHFEPYQRGNIVVFMPPDAAAEGSIPFIKRIIGMPGDTLDIRDGHVFINGRELNEPYIYPGQVTDPTNGQSEWVVPKGDYFVMGDHRENSSDSRVFGPIPASSIIGRAWLRYWPINTMEVIPTPTYPIVGPAGAAPASSPIAGAGPADVRPGFGTAALDLPAGARVRAA